MAAYKPQLPFTTAAYLLKPEYQVIKGVRKKVYPNPEPECMFFCSFKTYGGTETTSNDVLAVEDTANVEAWYSPEFSADCAIYVPQTKKTYEILGSPENINMRNQFVKFKVRGISGGA